MFTKLNAIRVLCAIEGTAAGLSLFALFVCTAAHCSPYFTAELRGALAVGAISFGLVSYLDVLEHYDAFLRYGVLTLPLLMLTNGLLFKSLPPHKQKTLSWLDGLDGMFLAFLEWAGQHLFY